MTVKELITKLLTLNPDAKVVCYDRLHKDDFWIRGVTPDKVIDAGHPDGLRREFCLENFFCSDVSACDREPLGSEVVVLH